MSSNSVASVGHRIQPWSYLCPYLQQQCVVFKFSIKKKKKYFGKPLEQNRTSHDKQFDVDSKTLKGGRYLHVTTSSKCNTTKHVRATKQASISVPYRIALHMSHGVGCTTVQMYTPLNVELVTSPWFVRWKKKMQHVLTLINNFDRILKN